MKTYLLPILQLFFFYSALAAPNVFSEAPHLGYQPQQSRAVWQLFNGEADNIRQLNSSRLGGSKYDSFFSAEHAGEKWFVKIIMIYSYSYTPLDYEYEWELKLQKERYAHLAEARVKLIFVDRVAFFSSGQDQYFIASYPFIPGKTLAYLEDQYVNAEIPRASTVYYRVVYRYAQVAALLHFDPKAPPVKGESLLDRPVRLYLHDRNGVNELYDEATDTIYLIDFSGSHESYQVCIPVREYLHESFFILEPVITPVCGPNYSCLINIFNTYIWGYTSALPDYDPQLLADTLWDYLLWKLLSICYETTLDWDDTENACLIFASAIEHRKSRKYFPILK